MDGASVTKQNGQPPFEERLKIPDTRDVLGDHLYQKVTENLGKLSMSTTLSEKITGMLMECGDEDIMQMLISEEMLTSRICVAYSCLTKAKEPGELPWDDIEETEKQELGCKLFEEVSKMNSCLCAQITGMLMELDCVRVRELLADKTKLKMAVIKSKSAIINASDEKDDSNLNRTSDIDREELGEKLYYIIHKAYPSEAGQITGMLLESDLDTLEHLLKNDDILWQKAFHARRVLHEYTNS